MAYAHTTKRKEIHDKRMATWEWDSEFRKAAEMRTKEIEVAARRFRKNLSAQ